MTKKSPKLKSLVWIDLEMTGLDVKKHRIIETAVVVTDLDLNIIAEGPVFAINQPKEIMARMDNWCVNQHTKSGLVTRVMQSSETEQTAEAKTLEFLQKYVEPNTSPICGNTVWQDRKFLIEYMPKLEAFFHYRQLDVSSLKILTQMWRPDILTEIEKTDQHLALADIKESIAELRIYKNKLFTYN